MTRAFVDRAPDEAVPWMYCSRCDACYLAQDGHACDELGFWGGLLVALAVVIVAWILVVAGVVEWAPW
jgi:hypothetical protein